MQAMLIALQYSSVLKSRPACCGTQPGSLLACCLAGRIFPCVLILSFAFNFETILSRMFTFQMLHVCASHVTGLAIDVVYIKVSRDSRLWKNTATFCSCTRQVLSNFPYFRMLRKV
jgi:hypothetical protein